MQDDYNLSQQQQQQQQQQQIQQQHMHNGHNMQQQQQQQQQQQGGYMMTADKTCSFPGCQLEGKYLCACQITRYCGNGHQR